MTRSERPGLTLIEVMIAIALLAIAVAIVYPNLFPPDTTPAATEAALVDQTKAMAVARAELLTLTVRPDGTWDIAAESAPSSILASGQLPEAPLKAFSLRVTELGACLPAVSDRLVEGPFIDAVSCMVRP